MTDNIEAHCMRTGRKHGPELKPASTGESKHCNHFLFLSFQTPRTFAEQWHTGSGGTGNVPYKQLVVEAAHKSAWTTDSVKTHQ